MIKTTKSKAKKLDRVKSSQLGMFMKLVEDDIPMEEFTCLTHLAKHISAEFDVDCRCADLEKYLSLDSGLVNDNFEVESRRVEYS